MDRPDLKAKLAKELSLLLTNLQRYGNLPDIDTEKFTQLTQQLEELSRKLIDSSGKIGQRLRDNELLNNLRMQLASPGGGCSFDIPIYHYWLQQPAEIRKQTITEWLNDFNQIRTAVGLLLELVRNNAKIENKSAVHGFHQELLILTNLRMIRMGIARELTIQVSIGRHFLSVRFMSHIYERPVQYTENLSFGRHVNSWGFFHDNR